MQHRTLSHRKAQALVNQGLVSFLRDSMQIGAGLCCAGFCAALARPVEVASVAPQSQHCYPAKPSLACYLKSDPCGMRVLTALKGKETLDAEEAT